MAGKLRPETFGPVESTSVTTAIVAGTTSGFDEFEVMGPVICITATTFNTACVMHANGGNKPITSAAYPAGYIVRKFFTTIQIDSGDIEIVGHKSAKELFGSS